MHEKVNGEERGKGERGQHDGERDKREERVRKLGNAKKG